MPSLNGNPHMASAKIEASAPESISPETMGLVTETPTGEPKFWRSLEEYAGEKNFDEMVQREFPRSLRSLPTPFPDANSSV